MKVIIELNENFIIENAENEDEVIIRFNISKVGNGFGRCKIDDLQLALRKMTAK